jgi:ABC-type multidrug transport system fused ATPase/permease subunit
VDPSKGQWQRIALARAVFKRAPILILDEPTSNVDPKAEEKIFNEVMAMNKDNIVLLISHRFSTVRQTDRILVLDNGKLVEQGTHDELMQYEGTYNQMFTAQAKGYR